MAAFWLVSFIDVVRVHGKAQAIGGYILARGMGVIGPLGGFLFPMAGRHIHGWGYTIHPGVGDATLVLLAAPCHFLFIFCFFISFLVGG